MPRVPRRPSDQLSTPQAAQDRRPLPTPASSLTGIVSTGHGGSGTGTAFPDGSVVIAGPSGVYTSDAVFVWDRTNHRLGIGTATPSDPLHVVGTVKISSLTTGQLVFPAAGGLLSGSPNVFWDAANSAFGILTNAPVYTFEVAGGGLGYFGKGGASGGATTVSGGATGTADPATITVVSTTGFPSKGAILIQSEVLTYTGKTATTFTGCVRGRFNSANVDHPNGSQVIQISLINASDDTAGAALLAMPAGQLYVAANGDFFEKGSSSAIAEFKIGARFTVGGNGGVSYGDGTQTAFFGIDGTNCYFGARSNHPVSIRVNNTGRVFFTSTLIQLQGTTSSFPALKRASAALEVRLADDSAYAELRALRVHVDAAERLEFDARSRITSPADGDLQLTNAAASGFTKLQLGGATTSFPALKRNAAVLEVKLADDSDFTELKAKVLRISDGTVLVRAAAALTNGAGAAAGTLTNAPAAGDPTKWIPIDDNGTTRYIPAW